MFVGQKIIRDIGHDFTGNDKAWKSAETRETNFIFRGLVFNTASMGVSKILGLGSNPRAPVQKFYRAKRSQTGDAHKDRKAKMENALGNFSFDFLKKF